MTPPAGGVRVRGRWQARLSEEQDVCPDCGGGKTKGRARCRDCATIARRLPARDLAAYWQQTGEAAA